MPHRKIKLLQSIAGKDFRPKGAIIDCAEEEARRLINAGVAEAVKASAAPATKSSKATSKKASEAIKR